MAFVRKTWKDRASEFINRRMLTKEDGTTELVTVERNEGTISEEGDAFNADNMNDLEIRVYDAFSEVFAQLTAGDNALFRFGINEKGEYGYVVADSEGADTVIPFSGKYRKQLIGALQNTNLGLTEDSTWQEIIDGLYSLFPESMNVLAYLGISSLSISGSSRSGAGQWHYKSSGKFDITHFNTLNYILSLDTSGGAANCVLYYEGGSITLAAGSKTVNVTNCKGEAYFRVGQYQQYHSNGDYTSGGAAYLTSAKVYV